MIIKYRNHFESHKRLCIVMDFASGTELLNSIYPWINLPTIIIYNNYGLTCKIRLWCEQSVQHYFELYNINLFGKFRNLF